MKHGIIKPNTKDLFRTIFTMGTDFYITQEVHFSKYNISGLFQREIYTGTVNSTTSLVFVHLRDPFFMEKNASKTDPWFPWLILTQYKEHESFQQSLVQHQHTTQTKSVQLKNVKERGKEKKG